MLVPWLLDAIADAVGRVAQLTPTTATLTVSSLAASRDSLVVAAMPAGFVDADFPYTILEFESGHARVVRTGTTSTKTFTWRAPLESDVTVGSTVTFTTTPLAGAAVSVGAVPTGFERRVFVAREKTTSEYVSIGNTTPPEYGCREETVHLVVGVETEFVHGEGDVDLASTRYREHQYLSAQVREVLREGMPSVCRLVDPREWVEDSLPRGGEPPRWIYRDLIRAVATYQV